MPNSTTQVWNGVLGELEVTLSEGHYKTWVKNTSLVAIDGSTAIVSVPNIFTRQWIQDKYQEQIFAALSKLIDGLEKVEYQIGSPAASKEAQDEDDSGTMTSPQLKSKAAKPIPTQNRLPRGRQLSETYTFDTFVVGDSNRLAFAAAKLVSEQPGAQYNPLFLYGPVGVGKTHLLWAINAATANAFTDVKAVYTSTESFLNEFTRAIREGTTKELTNKYRRLDLLLVDDLQFLAGKEKFQEEFFHTFNALHQAGKQIVLCSDRPPKAIPTLESRLRSRFEWGMVADIQSPDLETRIAILQNKALAQKFDLSNEIALMIAEMIETNIRELEGGLTRVMAHCQINNVELTPDVVTQVLGGARRSNIRKISPRVVVEQTAQYYNIKPHDLTGSKRDRQIVLPRQVAMYIMRDELNMSFPQIAHALGGRDHTTVMHGVRKITNLISSDNSLQHDIKTLKEKITNLE